MRIYQWVVYPPGQLLAVALGLGALGALGSGRARRSGLRAAAVVFSGLAVTVLLTTAAVNALSWRYWAPMLVLLPPAGAIGLTALLGASGLNSVAAGLGSMRGAPTLFPGRTTGSGVGRACAAC